MDKTDLDATLRKEVASLISGVHMLSTKGAYKDDLADKRDLVDQFMTNMYKIVNNYLDSDVYTRYPRVSDLEHYLEPGSIVRLIPTDILGTYTQKYFGENDLMQEQARDGQLLTVLETTFDVVNEEPVIRAYTHETPTYSYHPDDLEVILEADKIAPRST